MTKVCWCRRYRRNPENADFVVDGTPVCDSSCMALCERGERKAPIKQLDTEVARRAAGAMA